MSVAPQAVTTILAKLEPLLTRWHQDATLGEIAITIGNHEMQVEERPRIKHDGVPLERDWGRVKVIKAAGSK